MEYIIYKLNFQGPVHLGSKTLESSEYSFGADTLFSALCIEALKQGTEVLEELHQITESGKIALSDAFPYIAEEYYLPKPMLRIQDEAKSGNSVVKKAYKKLKYVPVLQFSEYLKGEFDVLNAGTMSKLGRSSMKNAVAIRGEEKTEPYRVGMYYFHEGSGLYLIIGYDDDDALMLVEELLESLSYSGIGGKRNAGLGRFTLMRGRMPKELKELLTAEGNYSMLLSGALPTEEELPNVLPEARYSLIKRSGFVASSAYAENQSRKRDLYLFKAGSCFKERFRGDIYDVSTKEGSHPVYRYAKPLFLGVNV